MASAAQESPGRTCLRRWRDAQRWRKLVDRELAPLRLSLTHWIVLEATYRLVRKSRDAVHQNEVARLTGLQRMVVSNAMWVLDKRHYVSRGPEFIGPGMRVFVTKEGEQAIAQGGACIEAVSCEWKSG